MLDAENNGSHHILFVDCTGLISGFLSQGNVAEGAKQEAAAQAENSRLEGYLEAACRREEGLNADLTQAHAQVTQLTADVKQLTSEVRHTRMAHHPQLLMIRQHWDMVPGLHLSGKEGWSRIVT